MKTTSIVSKQTKLVNNEQIMIREARGRRLALLGKVFMIQNSKTNMNGYYVESEFASNRYYYVQYKENDDSWCSCPDFSSNKVENCKHLYAVQYALHLGLVQQIGHKLPISQKT